MEVKATFKPGETGTKQLLQQYGNQLVRVRYRYDRTKQRRYKPDPGYNRLPGSPGEAADWF